jgi:hypothetical protein
MDGAELERIIAIQDGTFQEPQSSKARATIDRVNILISGVRNVVNHNSANAVRTSPQVPQEEERRCHQTALVADAKDTRVWALPAEIVVRSMAIAVTATRTVGTAGKLFIII